MNKRQNYFISSGASKVGWTLVPTEGLADIPRTMRQCGQIVFWITGEWLWELSCGSSLAALSDGLPASSCGQMVSRASSRSEEHTSELQSLMRISYAVFCLKKKTT